MKVSSPEGCLPADVPRCQLDVSVHVTGEYNIPDDSQLVSAITHVSYPVELLKPISIGIQHSVALQGVSEHSFSFVIAKEGLHTILSTWKVGSFQARVLLQLLNDRSSLSLELS